MMDVQQLIKEQVTSNPVVLYMKGTPQFPQCGFSAVSVQILKACGVAELSSASMSSTNPEIRNGIKEYANWPTIPQLYVRGEFIGGCDIMREMYEEGELQKLAVRRRSADFRQLSPGRFLSVPSCMQWFAR
jgi:monothiol glutaredoxin